MEWILVSALALCVGSMIALIVDWLPSDDSAPEDQPVGSNHQGESLARDHDARVAIFPAQLSWCWRPFVADFALLGTLLATLIAALWSFAILPASLAWAGFLLGWTLIAASIIDLRHYWLPDLLTLPLIPAGLLVAWLMTGTLSAQAIGAVAGYASLAFLRRLYWSIRGREGLGLGDAKLLAAAGAWVGWSGLPSVVLIAAATALSIRLVARGAACQDPLIAFGPYLALGLWIVWLHGPLEMG
jgi:leader peptidase (prepilin peptidase)/N-methyltransferase